MPIVNLDRAVLLIQGENVHGFLDPLITNACPPQAMENGLVFAALLTPQGKIIADFFIHAALEGQSAADDQLYLECPKKFAKPLLLRLKMYKLRAKIDIIDISDDFNAYAIWDGLGDLGHTDPRHARLGARFIAPSGQIEPENALSEYDAHRLSLGIPDSHWDFETTSMFPADANMDIVNGVDYQKGCFIGQEVVSRMHRKSEVRKRMGKLHSNDGFTNIETGDDITAGSAKIGTFYHASGEFGIGLIRLDRLAKADAPLTIGDTQITITKPDYD